MFCNRSCRSSTWERRVTLWRILAFHAPRSGALDQVTGRALPWRCRHLHRPPLAIPDAQWRCANRSAAASPCHSVAADGWLRRRRPPSVRPALQFLIALPSSGPAARGRPVWPARDSAPGSRRRRIRLRRSAVDIVRDEGIRDWHPAAPSSSVRWWYHVDAAARRSQAVSLALTGPYSRHGGLPATCATQPPPGSFWPAVRPGACAAGAGHRLAGVTTGARRLVVVGGSNSTVYSRIGPRASSLRSGIQKRLANREIPGDTHRRTTGLLPNSASVELEQRKIEGSFDPGTSERVCICRGLTRTDPSSSG